MHKVLLYPVPLIIDLLCGLLTIGIDPRRINAIAQGRQTITADMALLPGRFPATAQPSGWGLQSRCVLETALYRTDEKLAQVKAHQAVAPP